MPMLKRSTFLMFALALFALSAMAFTAQAGGGSPRLVQLDYHEEPGAQGRDQHLGAHVKNADSVRFATGFDGRKARASGRYRESITDTDIHDPEAKHPWVPAGSAGHKVVKLVRESLDENERATVRLRMKNGSQVEKERVVIELSECSQDPPLYPVSCDVKP